MKKIFLLLSIIIFILLVSFLYYRTKKQQPTTLTTPLTFPAALTGDKMDYIANITPATFPTQLPTYEVSKKTTSDEQKIVKALGFNGPPKTISSEEGVFQVWTNGQASMTVGGDPLNIVYLSGVTAKEQILQSSEKEAQNQAEKFLKEAALMPQEPIKLNVVQFQYFSAQGSVQNELPTRTGANVIEVNYQYTLAKTPVFERFPDSPNITIRLDGQGKVLFARVTDYGNINKTSAYLAVLGVQDATTRLKQGQGVLLNMLADADKNTEVGVQYSLESTEIKSVSLGLYYSPDGLLFAPVYLFKGEGYDRKNKRVVQTTTIVSAIP